jgi:hypothetical protein
MPQTTAAAFSPRNGLGKAPILPWRRVGIVVALIFAVSLSSIEALCRHKGYLPNVSDSLDLWSFWRSCVRGPQKTITLIGTSRLQAGVSIRAFEQCCPEYRIIQLSIMGNRSPIGTLRDLAHDEEFRGIVLCDLETPLLAPSRWNDQADHYLHRTSLTSGETVALAFIENNLAACQPELSIRCTLIRLLSGQGKAASFGCERTFRREVRFRFLYRGDLNLKRNLDAGEMFAMYQSNPIPSPERLCDVLPMVNELISKIRKRGGDVVFLRMPSSGLRFAIEEKFHSKARYWDYFAGTVRARCIHFRDVPALRDLKCSDDSHLDSSIAEFFTVDLVRELRRIGVLEHAKGDDSVRIAIKATPEGLRL